jgi:NAD(P)-dependent dehydrogenase (short-subunit alcohol dehydrogenase family)
VDLGLEDEVCLVTGSTAGIGLEVATRLAAEGAHVVSTGRRDEGPGELHVAADLTERGAADRVVAAAVERFGRIDGLVNNAGGTDIRKLAELTDDDWQRSFELNLMTAVRTTRASLPHMRAGSAIVNVSSTAGKRPSGGMPDYSVL